MTNKIIELESILQRHRKMELHSNNINKIINFLKKVPKENLDKYILMPMAETYALGVHTLRKVCEIENNKVHPLFTQDDGSKIYRPLTIKENIEIKVNDYESNKSTDERLRLFKRQIDSCTGIAYKAKTTKFKIIPICKELITIDINFDQYIYSIDYKSLPEIEFNNDKTLNRKLTKAEVIEDPLWRAVIEDDLNLLKTYRDIVFAETANTLFDTKIGMCFDFQETYSYWGVIIDRGNELWALYLDNEDGISSDDKSVYYKTNYNSTFLKLVNPVRKYKK